SSGRPLDHLSSRASLRPASAAMAAASPRNASARSRPAPLKKGSGGKAPPACQRGCRRLAVKRRETGFGEAIERLPPTLADRLSAALETEFEAEVGEDVRHLDRRGRWRSGLGPMAAGQRGHAAEQAIFRPADEPHRAVALDPPGDAVPHRARTPGPDGRKGFRRARGMSEALG